MKEKKIITGEAYIQTLKSQVHLCEISEMLDDFSEHIGVQQLQNVLEELKLITNMSGTLHQKLSELCEQYSTILKNNILKND